MKYPVAGAGLGLRRGLLSELNNISDSDVDFMEVAPKNWIGVGGRFGRQFRSLSERFPMLCHGLSLSIGSPSPLDRPFLKQLKVFFDEFNVPYYSEHLSYCSDHGHLYDLMPIPFSEEAAHHVAARIREVQDVLERTIAMENVSYYAAPEARGDTPLSELEFIHAVVEESGCELLLDVNNIYVNSINFNYDPMEFLAGLPGEKTAYLHIAGHYEEAVDLRVDSHGSDVIEPVWALLEKAYELYGVLPTLLERDFNFPHIDRLLGEVARIRRIQERAEQHGEPGNEQAIGQ